MRPKPTQSMPPVARPGTSSMPNQITTKQIVTAIAGSISSTVIEVDSTSAPEVRAPMITASSRAPTRTAAERRVSSAWRPVSAVRRWMIATSSGSHTTYAPWIAQPIRNVVNDGANARIHDPSAVIAVEISSTLRWPDEVAEACEQRHAEGADDQLCGLEPVDVGVRDPEVVGDVGEDRRVVALQDPAGDLDADQEADDADQVRGDDVALLARRGHRVGEVGHLGSLSISVRYQATPSMRSSIPRCSS